ncbi:MAG TPA: 3-hydroxyacyl-ACP dehydratase [Ohtaekwangia sp.]|uniref:3-hydroxyacyl-ACP dehydratase n=1 Tax=Ohtaekwangia sp. TaxID=2066019 RepID=UPI002F952BF4
MLATKQTITQYIPQRDPIVMIHNLVEVSDEHAVTQLAIAPDNVFVADGYFAEPGLVENIAQTAAVHVGYQCQQKNIPVPIGYIAAVRDLQIHSLPKQNSTITTSIRIVNQVLELTIAQGRVEQDGQLLCSCEMRIFAKIQTA